MTTFSPCFTRFRISSLTSFAIAPILPDSVTFNLTNLYSISGTCQYPGTFGINVFYSFFNQLFRFAEKHMPSGAGSCIFVRKSVFRNVGGFDKSLTFDDIHFIRLAAKKGLFGMLNTKIYVSDRRIRKYGLLNTTITYIALSVCFLFGAYQLANRISYSFGVFHKYK